MNNVNSDSNISHSQNVHEKSISFYEKGTDYIKNTFKKIGDSFSKQYISLTGRVTLSIPEEGRERVHSYSLKSLGLSKREFFAAKKAGKEKELVFSAKSAMELEGVSKKAMQKTIRASKGQFVSLGTGDVLVRKKNHVVEVWVKQKDHQGSPGELFERVGDKARKTLFSEESLAEIGLSKEDFFEAKKAGLSKELIDSAHAAISLEGVPKETMLKAIKASKGQFIMLPKYAVEDEIRVQLDAKDFWVRKTGHRVEVWKRESAKDPGLIDRIQKVSDQSIKYIKHVQFLDEDYLVDPRLEKSNLSRFAEVGIALEGGVEIEGVDAGFVMEAAKETYTERLKNPPSEKELDKEGKELCSLMDKMHEFGTHNDIKPDNIVEREDGSLRFIDFLGARELGAKEKTMTIFTGQYVRKNDVDALRKENNKNPKEKDIVKLDQLTKAIDIHEMGVTLYLRAIGKGVEDSNFPYKIMETPNAGMFYPEGPLKEPLFPEDCAVSPAMQKLIRAMLTEDPIKRIAAYNEAKKNL